MGKFARWRARLVLSLGIAIAASLFAGASALADNPPGCSPTGTGQPCVAGAGTQLQYGVFPPPNGFAVLAVGTGTAARGYFGFTSPFGSGGPNYVAKVTCLLVTGNDAIATGKFIQPASAYGQPVVMEAVDNGGGQPPRDLLRFSFTGSIYQSLTDPVGCLRPVLPPAPIHSGHIAVGRVASSSGD
jgi:hypothetical protein